MSAKQLIKRMLPPSALDQVRQVKEFRRTSDTRYEYARWAENVAWPMGNSAQQPAGMPPNRLRTFFEERREGRGIWKWDHYFDIYERHLSKFRNTHVQILEIGIYSGGSLDMWRNYFGNHCHIYGVDIEPQCKAYEDNGVDVFIGDQADRSFWGRVKNQVPHLDIVIDDGGHLPNQQIVTLEELLPHLRPGGVFLCEDVHGNSNSFASYVHCLAHDLNAANNLVNSQEDAERRIVCKTTPLQSAVASIHFYPFVIVIEKCAAPIHEMVAPKHGTEWQPHLS